MRRLLIPFVTSLALAAAPAFAQGSGSSGDIGGANTMGSGQQMSGASSAGSGAKGSATAPKKMRAKMKSKM